jgi:hypothetical protein
MNKEEKELLLVDLCARLPYGVKVKIKEEGVLSYDSGIGVIVGKEHVDNEIFIIQCKNDSWCLTAITEFVPYLRPMSSMTEEEHNEWFQYYQNAEIEELNKSGDYFKAAMSGDNAKYDWLNVHYFDYRSLIEKELALEAPEGIYNTKTE